MQGPNAGQAVPGLGIPIYMYANTCPATRGSVMLMAAAHGQRGLTCDTETASAGDGALASPVSRRPFAIVVCVAPAAAGAAPA